MVNDARDVLPSLLLAVDTLDWKAVRELLDDEVHLDYTSLFGGEPSAVSGGDAVAGWQNMLPGFDATQHVSGPVIVDVDGDPPMCRTTFRAYHVFIDDGEERSVWMIAGRYDVPVRWTPDGWKITGITLHALYEEGPHELTERATARVTAGSGGRLSR